MITYHDDTVKGSKASTFKLGCWSVASNIYMSSYQKEGKKIIKECINYILRPNSYDLRI